MKIIRVFLIALLSWIAFSADAQEPLPLNATWKDSARFYIKELKQGAIVVRLHTRSQAIAKLRTAGNVTDANTIEAMQREENKEIVQAFRSEFHYCKVYFFFGDSTDALLLGRKNGFFLNDSLQLDPAISLNEKFFMLAEKGNPQLQQKYDPTQPANQQNSDPGYLNATIVLFDQNLKQLKRPFPYYAQEPFPESLNVSNWPQKVKSLDKKLLVFYKKSL